MALLVLVLVLAGCFGSGAKGPSDPSNGSGDPTGTAGGTHTPGPTNGPTIPPPGNLSNLTLENCHGGTPTFDIPDAQARPYIPEPFTPRGFFPATAQVNMKVLVCERVVLANTVEEDVAVLFSHVGVRATNDSWDAESSLPMLGFDVLVSNQAVVDAFTVAGANAELATFEEETTQLPHGYTQRRWVYSSDRVTYDLTYQVPNDATGVEDHLGLHFWFGSDPYTRMDVDQTYTKHGLQSNNAGYLVLEGESAFLDMMASPVLFSGTGTFYSLSLDVPAVPQIFSTGS